MWTKHKNRPTDERKKNNISNPICTHSSDPRQYEIEKYVWNKTLKMCSTHRRIFEQKKNHWIFLCCFPSMPLFGYKIENVSETETHFAHQKYEKETQQRRVNGSVSVYKTLKQSVEEEGKIIKIFNHVRKKAEQNKPENATTLIQSAQQRPIFSASYDGLLVFASSGPRSGVSSCSSIVFPLLPKNPKPYSKKQKKK